MKTSPLKILLTCHQFFPKHYHGTERYTLDLAHSLQTLGHEIIVLTASHDPEESRQSPWHEYTFEQIRIICIDLTFFSQATFSGSYNRSDLDGFYADILCKERPDIIHCCHLLYLGTGFLSVAAKANVPIFMTLTDFFGICWTNRLQTCQGKVCQGPDQEDLNCIQDVLRTVKRPFKNVLLDFVFAQILRSRRGIRWTRHLLERNLLRSDSLRVPFEGIKARRSCITNNYNQIDYFIAPTSYLRDSYIRSGYHPEKIKLLRFGIVQPDEAETLELRLRYETLATNNRPLVIGFIGQIAKHKGVLDLLSAFESAAFNNCELHVYGNPTQSPKIDIRLAASARRNSSIKLLGTFPTAEIYRRLAKIDILVLPSTWAENSPLVLLNALASRTMVVVSDVEGMAELVSEGNAGHLVRPSDPAHLAKTLLSLVQDRSTLAAWQATLKKAYTTSPLDYAGEIDILYKTKIASAPRANYQRHTFPSHVSQPVIFTCTPLSEVVDMTNLSQIGWERLAGHHTTFASSPAGLELHTTSKQAHLIFESPHAEKSNIEITFDVLWPEAGLTVIYYGTKMHPEFGEERKLTRHVPANTWCRIHINPGTAKTHVTRLRWDPLFNAPHAKIFVANLELNSSAKHA